MKELLGPWPRRLLWLVFVVPFVFMVLGNFFYINHIQNEADRRWCDLLTLIDSQSQVVPPETEVARQFAIIISALRKELNC